MAALRALRINKSKSYNSLGDDILPDSAHNKPLDIISDDKARQKESSPRGVSNPFGSSYWKAQRRQKSLVPNGSKRWAELQDGETGGVEQKEEVGEFRDLNDEVGVDQIPDVTVKNGIVDKKGKGKVMDKWKTKFTKDFSKSKFDNHLSNDSDVAVETNLELVTSKAESKTEQNDKLKKNRFSTKILKDDLFAKRKHEKGENSETDTLKSKALAHEKQPWDHNLLKPQDSLDNQLIKPDASDSQNKDIFKDHNIERFLKDHLDRDRWGDRLIRENGACTFGKEMQKSTMGMDEVMRQDPNVLSEDEDDEDCQGDSITERDSDDDQFQVKKNLNLRTGFNLNLNLGKKFLPSSPTKTVTDGVSGDTRAKDAEGADQFFKTLSHNNNNDGEIRSASSQENCSISSDRSDSQKSNKEIKGKDSTTKFKLIKDLKLSNVKLHKHKKSLPESNSHEITVPNNQVLFLQTPTEDDWEASYKSTLDETPDDSLDWNSINTGKTDSEPAKKTRKFSFPSPAKKKDSKTMEIDEVTESPRKQSIKKIMAKFSQKTKDKSSIDDPDTTSEHPDSFSQHEFLEVSHGKENDMETSEIVNTSLDEDWMNEEIKIKEFNYRSKMKIALSTISPKKSPFKSKLTSSEKKSDKINTKACDNQTDCETRKDSDSSTDLSEQKQQVVDETFKMCEDKKHPSLAAGCYSSMDTSKSVLLQPEENLMLNFDDDFTDIAKRSNQVELEFPGDPFSLEYINPFSSGASESTNPFNFPGWETSVNDNQSSSTSQPRSSVPSNTSLVETNNGQNMFPPPPQFIHRNSSISSFSESFPFPLTSSTSMCHLSKQNSDPFSSSDWPDTSDGLSSNTLRIKRDSLLDMTEEEFMHGDFAPNQLPDSPPTFTSSNRMFGSHRKEFQKAKFSFSSSNLSQLCEKTEKTGFSGSMWDCSYLEDEEDETEGAGRVSGNPNTNRKKASRMLSLEHNATRFMFGRLVSASAARMPSGDMPEAASLLGGDGPEELRSIQLSVAGMRTLVSDGSLGDRQQVETEHGPITIATVGDTNKPTILTYHDLGLNHVTNFQSFFLYPEMRALLHSFRVVSVNAPGQEEGAQTLPEGYVYPTMDQLAETVERVRQHLGLRTFIGLGVGLGANVLSRYALLYPTQVDALLLINCSGSKAGWLEWGYQKLNIRQLKAGTMTTATVDYLLWHCFGKTEQCAQDLVTVFRQHFEGSLNATNLGLLIDSYIARTDLGIMRELDPHKKKEVRMIRCPILNMTSNYSQHIEDSESFNGRLDPVTSNYMKVQDCGMVLEEQPGKVVEAFRLFLQGQGYALHSRRLNCRQNSLPLIRDIKHPNPCPELLSSLRNAADDDDDDRATTNGGSSPSDVTHDGGSEAANGNLDGVTVGVLSTNGGGSDKDIRITENPLEHPAV